MEEIEIKDKIIKDLQERIKVIGGELESYKMIVAKVNTELKAVLESLDGGNEV